MPRSSPSRFPPAQADLFTPPPPTLSLKNGTRVPYQIQRNPRLRRKFSLGLTHGVITFSAPLHVPEPDLIAFALQHQRWITNRLTEHAHKQQEEHESKALHGRVCVLPESWWRQAAEKLLKPRTEALAAQTGLLPSRVAITATKGRWGSCTRGGTVRLSCWLLRVPENLRDYVIIHELAHLRQLNHGPKFWKIVEAFEPDYKAKRKALQALGRKIL